MNRTIILFIILLLVISIARGQNSCGVNLQPIAVWNKTTSAVSYKVDPAIPSNYVAVIEAAASKWNSHSSKNWPSLNKQVTSSSQPSYHSYNGSNSISFGYLSNSSTLAVTEKFPLYAAEILEADIVINYELYMFGRFFTNYSTVSVVPSNQHDLLTVMVHEFGHFLGLGHAEASNCTDQVMYYNIPPGKRRYIQPYEATVLRNYIIAN